MNKYKVSVIIPCYNGEKFLKRCLESLKQQTMNFKYIEVIFVNDCSTDNSNNILMEFSKKYSNCKIFNLKKNSGGPAKPVRIGIEKATSNYIMFLDCDDTYEKNMCEVLYNTIIETNVDFVVCNHNELKNRKSLIKKQKENLERTVYNPKKDFKVLSKIARWDKIFNRKFMIDNNINCPIDIAVSDDVILCTKAYLNSNQVISLENFFGYNYYIYESEDSKSFSRDINSSLIKNALYGYFYLAKLIKSEKRDEILPFVFEPHLRTTLTNFIKLSDSTSNKISFLKEIYDFEKFLDTPIIFKEKWARILNYLIIKRKFKLAILFSNIIKILINSKTIRQIHRNQIQKKVNS